MSKSLESLPPDIQAMLDRAKREVGPSAEARARLRQSLQPMLSPPAAQPPTPGPAGAGKPLKSLTSVLGHKAIVALVSFGLGAGSGAVVTARRYAHQPPGVSSKKQPVPAPPASPTVSRPATPVVVPATTPPPASHPVRRSARAPAPAAAPPIERPDTQLQTERTLLERGRTALARRDTSGALAAVEEHARRFPEGLLQEEREALRIQTLVAAGRTIATKAAFLQFEQRFPHSPLLPALRREVEEQP